MKDEVTWAGRARILQFGNSWTGKLLAASLAVILVVPAAEAATLPPQPGMAAGAGTSQSQSPSGPSAAAVPDAPSAQPDQEQQASHPQQPSNPPQPLGTAAAPVEKTVGIPASRPAGAAIAPAKQRRTRSILIRVGILVGAAAAVGAVVALSHASPSRP